MLPDETEKELAEHERWQYHIVAEYLKNGTEVIYLYAPNR